VHNILGFLRSVYNFFVGDPILLMGTLVFFVLIGGLARTGLTQAPLLLGLLLVAGILATLALSLWRETQPQKP
jgi:hypothetical protein